MSRPRPAVVLLVAVLLTVGCSSTGGDAQPPQTSRTEPGISTSSGEHTEGLSVRRAVRFSLPRGYRALAVEVQEAGVAFVASNVEAPETTRLFWRPLDGAGPATTIRTPRAPWTITELTGSAKWLAWVEQRGLPDDPMAAVAWRIMAMRVGGGTSRVVLNSAKATPLTPGILLTRSRLIYNTYNGLEQRSYDFRIRSLVTGQDDLIAADVAAGQLAYDGRHVITTVTEATSGGPGASRSDVYMLDDGPTAITHDDQSAGPQYADGVLLWVSGDAAWVSEWDGSHANNRRELFRHPDPLPSLGQGFVADMVPRDGFYAGRIVLTDDPDTVKLLRNPAGTRMVGRVVAGGELVAWTVAPRGDVSRGVDFVVARVSTDAAN